MNKIATLITFAAAISFAATTTPAPTSTPAPTPAPVVTPKATTPAPKPAPTTVAPVTTAPVKAAPNAGDKPSKAPQGTSELALASNLAQYGFSKNDPIALISAAKIAKAFAVKADTTKKTSEGPKTTAAPAPKTTGVIPTLDVTKILAKAKELAGGRKDILALIDEVKNSASKEVLNDDGYSYHDDRVQSNSTDSWKVAFVGGEIAAAIVSGDGDTDLDMKVYDNNDNLICESSSYSDDESCAWIPRETAFFYIKIQNRGSVYNNYEILFK